MKRAKGVLVDLCLVYPWMGYQKVLELILRVRVHRGNREWFFLLFAALLGIPGVLLGLWVHPGFWAFLAGGIFWCAAWFLGTMREGYRWLEVTRWNAF